MCAVHDDGVANLQHVWDVAEIDHQVVISHHVATLGEPHLHGASLTGFLHGITHVTAAQELGFLDVHHTSRPCCCH